MIYLKCLLPKFCCTCIFEDVLQNLHVCGKFDQYGYSVTVMYLHVAGLFHN